MSVVASAGAALSLASGAKLWEKRDGSSLNAIVSSPDGTKVFMTGASVATATNPGDYLTVARDSVTGAKLWARTYNGPGNGPDGANDIVVSPDGTRVFVTGLSGRSPTTCCDYATVAYDALTGTELWARRHADGDAHDIAVSPNGARVFVTGAFTCTTVAYRASSGAELWVKSTPNCGANDIAVSPDGTRVFVTGQSFSDTTGKSGFFTIAYAASTGTKLWVKNFYGPFPVCCDIANALAVSPDGAKVFVTGAILVDPSVGLDDAATVAYNAATGARLWVKRYNGPTGGGDAANDIALSPGGTRVFITGVSSDLASGESDYVTVAYKTSTGAELWAKNYDGPASSSDFARSIAVSPGGTRVIVTGLSTGSTSQDWATIAYDASTGAGLWARRYNGPGNSQDLANDIVVSPDGGAVFVTGVAFGTDSNIGTTVAYAA